MCGKMTAEGGGPTPVLGMHYRKRAIHLTQVDPTFCFGHHLFGKVETDFNAETRRRREHKGQREPLA